jgi:YkoP-like protein
MDKMDADLDELARMIAAGKLGSVRALHGVTLFARPGRRLGFEVRPVRHNWNWSLQRYFLIGLLPIYHRDGWREFDRMRRDRWPAELWMSIPCLMSHRQRPASA